MSALADVGVGAGVDQMTPEAGAIPRTLPLDELTLVHPPPSGRPCPSLWGCGVQWIERDCLDLVNKVTDKGDSRDFKKSLLIRMWLSG